MITTIIAASVSTACALWAIRSAWINSDLKGEKVTLGGGYRRVIHNIW